MKAHAPDTLYTCHNTDHITTLSPRPLCKWASISQSSSMHIYSIVSTQTQSPGALRISFQISVPLVRKAESWRRDGKKLAKQLKWPCLSLMPESNPPSCNSPFQAVTFLRSWLLGWSQARSCGRVLARSCGRTFLDMLLICTTMFRKSTNIWQWVWKQKEFHDPNNLHLKYLT